MYDVDLWNSGNGGGSRRRKSRSDGEDPAAWNALATSFSQVQTVLDRNQDLIQQARENHQSRIPDNIVRNVAIINKLNGNISKVASIYSDLSTNFSGVVRNHRQASGRDDGDRRDDS